jgi:hypothetical protein
MTGPPTPKSSDALELLEQLTGSDPELREAIDEERLVLQVAQAAHLFRERCGGREDALEFHTGLSSGTLAGLERGKFGVQALRRLQRIAWRLELDVRLVLVPRPRNGRRGRVADIA